MTLHMAHGLPQRGELHDDPLFIALIPAPCARSSGPAGRSAQGHPCVGATGGVLPYFFGLRARTIAMSLMSGAAKSLNCFRMSP